MRPIWEAWYCHIEVTNICAQNCAYCTRYIRHVRKDQMYFMDLDFFRKAVLSLEGFPGKIGIIGGEPLLHPKFEEMCLILKDEFKIPKGKTGIFLSDKKRLGKYRELINATFGMIAFNEHSKEQRKSELHQPITIAIGEAVKDKKYRKELIDNCWVQNYWCPSITPKGGFICEVAEAIDIILDGPGGYPIEPGWWKKTPEDFQDQVDKYCKYCGCPVPLKRELLDSRKEKITPGLLSLFKEHNLRYLGSEYVDVFDRQLTIKEMEENKILWDPRNYRQDKRGDMRRGYKTRPPKRQKTTPIKIGEGE